MQQNTKLIAEYLNEVYPITKGVFKIPLSITEVSIEKNKLKELQEKLSVIFNAIKNIAFYFLDKRLEGYLIDNFRRELYLRIHENYNWKLGGIIRWDMLNFKVIELNADYIEGIIQIDITSKWISKIFNFKGDVQYTKPIFKDLFDKKALIVYSKEYKFIDEFYLEAKVLNTIYISDEQFYHDLESIKNKYNIIRRALHLFEIKNIEAFLQFENVNDILFSVLGNKANLAYLSGFADDEVKWAMDIVAKTIFKPRFKKFVCKPAFGTWDSVKFNERGNNCVYQELIDIPKRKIRYLDVDNHIKEDVFYYDFCPIAMYDGSRLKFGNILMRFSKSKILNVAKGGE